MVLCLSCGTQRRQGAALQHAQRLVSRENRIAILSEMMERSDAEEAELTGLLSKNFREQYDPSLFTEEHVRFKQDHNQALCDLALYCQQQRHQDNSDIPNHEPISILYLDGPDAQTTLALQQRGFQHLYVVNRHEESCQALEAHLPADNIICDNVQEALSQDPLRDIMFGAYYLDGCGGHAPQIMAMLEGALAHRAPCSTCIAVGWSIVGGNRDVIHKHMQCVQKLVALAKDMNMTVQHVLDDPERYGVNVRLNMVEGSTFTTWFVLEPMQSGGIMD